MRTKLAALLLAVLLLTGCVPYVRWQITTNIPQTQQMPAPTPAPTAMPQPDSGLSRRQMVYGSAGLLTEPTVLVSVYLNDAAARPAGAGDGHGEVGIIRIHGVPSFTGPGRPFSHGDHSAVAGRRLRW